MTAVAAPVRGQVAPRLLSACEATVLGVLALAVAVGAVRVAAAGWTPISDEAFMELAVRDVPGELPLTGVYSRFGWNHPGPALFYLLALPYRLAGSASWALAAAALVGQAGATALAWWVVRRIDRVGALVVLAGLCLVLATTDGEQLRRPWNPQVALVGAALLVVLAWSASSRRRAGALGLLPVGTLLVQAHVVTGPFVAVTVLVALVVAVAPGLRAVGTPVPWRWIASGALIAAVLWVPPLVEQVSPDGGNLTDVLAGSTPGQRSGVVVALSTASQGFDLWPSVLRAELVRADFAPTGWAAPWWLAAPAAGAWVAVRRRDAEYLRALAVVAGSLAAAVATIALISDALFNYLLVWYRSLPVLAVAVGLAALVRAMPRTGARAVVVGAAVVGTAAALSVGVAQVRADNPLHSYEPTVEELTEAVLDAGLDGTLAVDAVAEIRAAEVAAALMLQLERNGRDVTSGDFSAARIREHRADRRPDERLLVAPVEERSRLLADGWTIVGEYQPLSDEELARSQQLRRERAGIDSTPTGDQVEQFRRIAAISQELEEIERGRVPMLVAVRPA